MGIYFYLTECYKIAAVFYRYFKTIIFYQKRISAPIT